MVREQPSASQLRKLASEFKRKKANGVLTPSEFYDAVFAAGLRPESNQVNKVLLDCKITRQGKVDVNRFTEKVPADSGRSSEQLSGTRQTTNVPLRQPYEWDEQPKPSDWATQVEPSKDVQLSAATSLTDAQPSTQTTDTPAPKVSKNALSEDERILKICNQAPSIEQAFVRVQNGSSSPAEFSTHLKKLGVYEHPDTADMMKHLADRKQQVTFDTVLDSLTQPLDPTADKGPDYVKYPYAAGHPGGSMRTDSDVLSWRDSTPNRKGKGLRKKQESPTQGRYEGRKRFEFGDGFNPNLISRDALVRMVTQGGPTSSHALEVISRHKDKDLGSPAFFRDLKDAGVPLSPELLKTAIRHGHPDPRPYLSKVGENEKDKPQGRRLFHDRRQAPPAEQKRPQTAGPSTSSARKSSADAGRKSQARETASSAPRTPKVHTSRRTGKKYHIFTPRAKPTYHDAHCHKPESSLKHHDHRHPDHIQFAPDTRETHSAVLPSPRFTPPSSPPPEHHEHNTFDDPNRPLAKGSSRGSSHFAEDVPVTVVNEPIPSHSAGPPMHTVPDSHRAQQMKAAGLSSSGLGRARAQCHALFTDDPKSPVRHVKVRDNRTRPTPDEEKIHTHTPGFRRLSLTESGLEWQPKAKRPHSAAKRYSFGASHGDILGWTDLHRDQTVSKQTRDHGDVISWKEAGGSASTQRFSKRMVANRNREDHTKGLIFG